MTHRQIEVETLQGIRRAPMADGDAGTRQTLKFMAALARRAHTESLTTKFKATQLTRGIAGHDFRAKADRIFEFCRDQIQYQRDPLMGESVQAAQVTLIREAGDCDDKSVLLASLLGSIGIRSRFVVASYDGKRWHHVWVTALLPRKVQFINPATGAMQTKLVNEWVSYDPTPERAPSGWEGRSVKRMTYGIFGREADQLAGFLSTVLKIGSVGANFIPIPGVGQAVSAGLGVASGLAGRPKTAKPKDADIAAAIDQFTADLQTGKYDPASVWESALTTVRAPGGGAATIAASQRLWDAVERMKAAQASGNATTSGNSSTNGNASTSGNSSTSGSATTGSNNGANGPGGTSPLVWIGGAALVAWILKG
jgi:hypothetical protein